MFLNVYEATLSRSIWSTSMNFWSGVLGCLLQCGLLCETDTADKVV